MLSRTSLLLFFALASNLGQAQTYVRTKHNFGVTFGYSPTDMSITERAGSLRVGNNGQAISAGLTKQVARIVYPEIFYLRHQGFTPYSDENNTPVPFRWNGLGLGCLLKVDVAVFDVRKRKGYCFGRVLNLIAGGDYVLPFAVSDVPFEAKMKGEGAVKVGFGLYSAWGGSKRSHKTWTIHWEAAYRHGLSPFMTVEDRPVPGRTESWKHGSVNLTLRVMRHKVFKFSDM
ncbi:MAG: hypothetical protein FD123_3177 [Bacteroidetes bacterium]|nr:MAG: hypothetical protein FD123_3177 [Bacteroidota bacterium]